MVWPILWLPIRALARQVGDGKSESGGGEGFKIDVDNKDALQYFDKLLRQFENPSGLMRDIGEALTESTQARFKTSTSPDGIPWLPLRDGSGRRPLLDTGAMRDNISPTSGPDWVEIRAGAKQAPWHQQGSAPYLPARPFMGLSEEDEGQINRLAIAWLDPD